MTEDVKLCLYEIVLREPFATAEWYAIQLYQESGEMFCSRYINRILKKMKTTIKNVTYERKNKFTSVNLEYYFNWIRNYKELDRRRLVFVDQTGFNRFSFHKNRGRAPVGYRCGAHELASSCGQRLNCTGMIPWDPSRPKTTHPGRDTKLPHLAPRTLSTCMNEDRRTYSVEGVQVCIFLLVFRCSMLS